MADDHRPTRDADADEDGLFRAVLADPWDALARGVYADWMEERGSAQAAASTRWAAPDRTAAASLLADAMRAGAPCDFAAVLSPEGLAGVAIAARTLASKRFEREGPAWLRRHHVAEVRPGGKAGGWPAVLAGGWVAQARGLCFAGGRFAALDALAASPWLGGLASLSFGPDVPRGDALADFFGQAGLRGLCRLSRRAGDFTGAAMRAVVEGPFLPALRSFDCGRLDDEAASLLLRSRAFDGLVTLAIMRGGNAGAREVAEARGLAGLRNLDLYRSAFDDGVIDAFAGSALVARLRRLRLDLAGYETTRAVERLARALPPDCRLVLGGGGRHREALAAVLGDRLEIEEGSP